MIRSIAVALLSLAGAPAVATQEYTLPTLFDVTGVAANNELNIRAEPDADAALLGTLAPDARGIEVVAKDPTSLWGRVNTGEASGWVAMRYLAYRTDVWVTAELPVTLSCFGTEPFWSLRPEGGQLRYSTPDAPEQRFKSQAVLDSGVFGHPRRAVVSQGADGRLTASIVPAPCTDGMSDRAFGLDVSVILEGEETPLLLTGCCSLAP